MAPAATRRGPRGRTLARLVTALALLGSARPTSAQDANATNATASVNVTMAPPPPAQPSPPPAEATVAPPPPPARPSMDELKATAARRVLDIPRFFKTEDECPEELLAPPSVVAAPDRRFLLPDNPAMTCARLFLADAIGQIIRNGLGIMGVQAVQEMN